LYFPPLLRDSRKQPNTKSCSAFCKILFIGEREHARRHVNMRKLNWFCEMRQKCRSSACAAKPAIRFMRIRNIRKLSFNIFFIGISERQRLQKTIVRDALELTLSIERRGYTFYTNASRKTRQGSGRLMFQRLAAEESDHLRRLQQEYRVLLDQNDWLKREPARLPVSRKIAEEIFPQKELRKIEVSDETTDIQALHIAMDLERRSRQFFTDFAKELPEAGGKKIFMEFAEDEESHLRALRAEYQTLVGS